MKSCACVYSFSNTKVKVLFYNSNSVDKTVDKKNDSTIKAKQIQFKILIRLKH